MSCSNTFPIIDSSGWYILSSSQDTTVYDLVTQYTLPNTNLASLSYYNIIFYSNKDNSGGLPNSSPSTINWCYFLEDNSINQIKSSLAYCVRILNFETVDLSGFYLSFTNNNALREYVSSSDNSGGPVYCIFDQVSYNGNQTITFTAENNIDVSCILIGMGGKGADRNGDKASSGGGGGGGGIDYIQFSLLTGQKFTCEFNSLESILNGSSGYHIVKAGSDGSALSYGGDGGSPHGVSGGNGIMFIPDPAPDKKGTKGTDNYSFTSTIQDIIRNNYAFDVKPVGFCASGAGGNARERNNGVGVEVNYGRAGRYEAGQECGGLNLPQVDADHKQAKATVVKNNYGAGGGGAPGGDGALSDNQDGGLAALIIVTRL